MKRILMVCLGNICRSPIAHGIMENKSKENGLGLIVDSAGTASYHIGEPPDYRAIAKAAAFNVDISMQRARQFQVSDFDDYDQILVMDGSNLRDVLNLTRNTEDKKKVNLILNYLYPGENRAVPDPYYGGDRDFENVFRLLDEACNKIIEDLVYER